MDNNEAKALAQAFLNSGESRYKETFTITQSGQDSGEVIVIVALRTNRRGSELLEKAMIKLSESYKAVAGPAGLPCPVCGGSGRL